MYVLWFQTMYGDNKKDTIKIFIGNLRENANENKLRATFEQFGTVVECAVLNKYGFAVSINSGNDQFILGNIRIGWIFYHLLKC